MGLFSNLFARTPDYPHLDPNSSAAKHLAEVEAPLNELVERIHEPLEVVPSDHAAYVFIGKPPKRFGLAWIHDGEVSGLNTLIQEHHLSPGQVDKIMDELRRCYERHMSDSHYTADVQDRKVVVTVSDELEHEVHDIIEHIVH